MRELLETLRLPGESQPIERITETFAKHFFSFGPRKYAIDRCKRSKLNVMQLRSRAKTPFSFWHTLLSCSIQTCTIRRTELARSVKALHLELTNRNA